MGCLVSPNSNNDDDEIDKQFETGAHGEYTETYDPANMSVSRDSTMVNYQFTGKRSKGSFKVPAHLNTAIRLSTILDTENENGIELNTDTKNSNNNTNRYSIPNGYISKRDISELLKLDLSIDAIPKPRKRVIFISITQLNACIDDIPSYILSESIFCFKAERVWFFPSNNFERFVSNQSIRHKMNFNNKFLNVLTEKNEKNLILWLQDDKTWNHISHELIEINDIYYHNNCKKNDANDEILQAIPTHSAEDIDINKSELESEIDNKLVKKYKALKLDENWWRNKFERVVNAGNSLYCDSGETVIEEVKESKLKFNPTMELLYQSNPTLIPMRGFDIEMYINQHYDVKTKEQDTEIGNIITPYSPPLIEENIVNSEVNNMTIINISDTVQDSNSITNIDGSSNCVVLTPAPSSDDANKYEQNIKNLIEKNSVSCEQKQRNETDIVDMHDNNNNNNDVTIHS